MGRPRKWEEKFLVRLPPTTMTMVRHIAARREWTFTETIRRFIDYAVVASMLDLMDDEEAVEEMAASRPDFDRDVFRAELEREEEVAREAMLGRPQSVALVAERVLG